MATSTLPLFVSIPHSGEKVPDFCNWLQGLPETTLMCDVDRFVDQLYQSAIEKLRLPLVKTEWHRYAADLNRVPEDVDMDSVMGSKNPSGSFARGFHWVITTTEIKLMPKPISVEMHQKLIQLIYEPFHESVRNQYKKIHEQGAKEVFHLDLHSMPGLGTKQHRDPGERRADIVVSDCKTQSSRADFVDLVIASYTRAGFKVAYNWPYFGGRVSEQYGDPKQGHHCVQVELNRSLYMDENTKHLVPHLQSKIMPKLQSALQMVTDGVKKLQ